MGRYPDGLRGETNLARMETPTLTPSFWWPRPTPSCSHIKRLLPSSANRQRSSLVWVISIVHAGVHVIGWELSLPTSTEIWIWRILGITLLVVMAIGGAVPVLSTRDWFDFSFNLLWIWIRPARNTWIRRQVFNLVVNFAYSIYVIARILISAEICFSFHALPLKR